MMGGIGLEPVPFACEDIDSRIASPMSDDIVLKNDSADGSIKVIRPFFLQCPI